MAAFARPLERGGALTGPAAGSAVEPFDDDTCGSGGSTTSSTVSGGPGASAGGNTSGSANPSNAPASAGNMEYATFAFKSEQGLPASFFNC